MRDPQQSNEYPDNPNIHNLANYYNFGYVKISYQYYMKIDADQIYFPQKMQQLRDFLIKHQYRVYPKKKRTVFDRVKSKAVSLAFAFLPGVHAKLFWAKWANVPADLVRGINVSLREEELCMPLKKDDYSSFNGIVGDTMLGSNDHTAPCVA